MIHELNHFGIVIRDLKKSLAFYQDLLGAKVVYKGFIPPTETDVIYLRIPGGMIELFTGPAAADGDVRPHAYRFMSNDLDADYAR